MFGETVMDMDCNKQEYIISVLCYYIFPNDLPIKLLHFQPKRTLEKSAQMRVKSVVTVVNEALQSGCVRSAVIGEK